MEEVKELEEEILEEAESKEDLDEGGIFDEDLKPVEDGLESIGEDLEHVEESDFDIGSTLLSAAAPVESWSGQNLEDTISRERVEKDWGDDEKFVAGDFYKSSDSGDVYGPSGSDVYSSGGKRGSDVYGPSGSGSYDTGKDGTYSAQGGDVGSLKSYDQIKDDRRGGRSMLEIAGFEDKDKQKNKDFKKDFVVYEARDAA